MKYVARIHLKTGENKEIACENRGALIDYCLKNEKEQNEAI